jgi:hypothetical protein
VTVRLSQPRPVQEAALEAELFEHATGTAAGRG